MVSGGLRKVSKTAEVCIFCSLRVSASRPKRPLLWRSLHSTSAPRKPSASTAAVKEEGDSQPYQRSQWASRRSNERLPNSVHSSSQHSSATLNPLEISSRSTAETLDNSRVSSYGVPRSSGFRSPDGYNRSSGWGQGSHLSSQAHAQPRDDPAFSRQSSLSANGYSPKWKPQPRISNWNHVHDPRTSPEWSNLRRRTQPDSTSRDSRSEYQATESSRNEFVSLTESRENGNQHEPWQPLKSLRPQPIYKTPAAPPPRFSVRSRSRPVDAQSEGDPITPSQGSSSPSDLPVGSPVLTSFETVHPSSEPSPRDKRTRDPTRRSRYEALSDDSRGSSNMDSARRKVRSKQNRQVYEGEDEDRLEDEDEDLAHARGQKRERKRLRKQEKARGKGKASGSHIVVPEFISIGTLATALKVRIEDFAHKLTAMGFDDFTHDYVIDGETAGLIASEFGYDPIVPSKDSEHDLVALPPPDDTSLVMPRPPVITIMGHVDHGKTTLLDWLRKSSVAASEHGGITQHIGAFTVAMPSGRIITFLDTPGHAAFLDMRARGASVTDIVILVVAADDSVKPQTIEAIKHAKDAKVPMIVAINKMDKEDAEPERVKHDLARHGVEVEDFGGETQTVCVSGKTGLGMEELEESAIALADILDVRACTTGQVEGWIIEATARSSGKVATVLVRRGTLTIGDVIVAGQTWSRVRTLRNEAGVLVESAGPGTPVEVDGWREQPDAGAEVIQAPDEQRARRAAAVRIQRAETEKLAEDVLAVNEARRAQEAERDRQKALKRGNIEAEVEEEQSSSPVTGLTEVPFVLRADVSGSVEALQASVLALGNSEVRPVILRSSFGPLSPTDIDFAATAGGHVISFNQPVDGAIKRTAERSGVKILDESIIYRLTDEIKTVLEEKLPPLLTSRVTGEAEIAQIFDITLKGKKKMPVAGCKVRNGNMVKGSKVKVLREKEVLYNGLLTSLKNQKKDVNEMRKGTECGLAFEAFDSFQPGDQVQCYETKEERRKL